MTSRRKFVSTAEYISPHLFRTVLEKPRRAPGRTQPMHFKPTWMTEDGSICGKAGPFTANAADISCFECAYLLVEALP